MSVDPDPADLPPVWAVSLRRAVERREFVQAVYSELGLQPVLVDAVDGRALSTAQLAEYSDLRAAYAFGRSLRKAEIAIALSHLAIWRRMVDEQLAEVLVVEDDVRPDAGLLRVLEARERLPADADVVTMHSLFSWATPRPVDGPALVDGYRVCTYERTPMGAQAYLLRRRGACRLVDVARPIRLPADELLFRARPAGLRVYGVEPSPVGHDEFPSELHAAPAGDDDRTLFERIAFSPVRAAGRIARRVRSGTWHRPR